MSVNINPIPPSSEFCIALASFHAQQTEALGGVVGPIEGRFSSECFNTYRLRDLFNESIKSIIDGAAPANTDELLPSAEVRSSRARVDPISEEAIREVIPRHIGRSVHLPAGACAELVERLTTEETESDILRAIDLSRLITDLLSEPSSEALISAYLYYSTCGDSWRPFYMGGIERERENGLAERMLEGIAFALDMGVLTKSDLEKRNNLALQVADIALNSERAVLVGI